MPLPDLRILIVQPRCDDGPAFLGTWLANAGLTPRVCDVDGGATVPAHAGAIDALAVLGGSMSANDPLPFLRDTEALIRDAVQRGVPVIGHCLGGQLLARALGAEVTDNPAPEIGWSRIRRADSPSARTWLGDAADLPVFQWHFQTFALPAGGEWLAGSASCANQAFAIGPHLGMQFHIEVDAAKLDRWCAEAPAPGSALASHPAVQTEASMRSDTRRLLAHSQSTAARIYRHWLDLAMQRSR